jgi:UDP-glucose 4-epimerase
MKIMITGGAGFIGSHLCDSLLNEHHEIIIVTRNSKNKENINNILSKIIIENVDVTNFQGLEDVIIKHHPDIIFHLAGNTSHKQSFDTPIYDVDINSKSTLVILETIRKLGLKCKFILGSTFIVIGKNASLPIDENTPCNPSTIYGANRLLSEHYCKIYNNVYDIDTIIFRITNSFGPREQYETPTKNALNYMIYRAFKNQDVSIFNEGKFFRDIIYVSDVINGLNIIMKNGKSGNVYWIASGTKTWFYDLGKYLKELTNAKITYVPSPEYTSKVDVGNFLVDNSKLCSLGWNPHFSLKDGIEKTLEFFKNNDL